MKDSKVLPTCLSLCEDVYPGHSQENRTFNCLWQGKYSKVGWLPSEC